jgi:hypothetical protein
MAASKSMLESLLARVRQRAAEPRHPSMPQQKAPAFDARAGHFATSPAAPAPAAAAVARPAPVAAPVEDELIEEYDDELVEILDDDDVASDSEPPPSAPPSSPLELRVSAPSVEMRRRAVPPSSGPSPVAAPRAAAPAPVPAVPAAALRAEVVGRRPIPATAVVQAQATRPDARSAPFLELLDASLELGE